MLENDWHASRLVLLYDQPRRGVNRVNGASHPIWVFEGLLKAMSLMDDPWKMNTASELDSHLNWMEEQC
jgi:hypothetical protein